jgi:cytochrome c oxidase subunit 1
MQIGMLGMRRRIADYDPTLGFDTSHLIITIAGYLIGVSVLIFFINLIYSAKHGQEASGNVWQSRSPEWTILPSPSPVHNYKGMPFEVVGEPYDYGLEGSNYVLPVKQTGQAD